MDIKEPTSMDECLYFTRRTVGKGSIKAWVLKEDCQECHKSKMVKPRDPKTGRPKIRAKEYVCPSCNHAVLKEEYEPSLNVNIKYTCPHCLKQGVSTTKYKVKKMRTEDVNNPGEKKTAKVIRIQCEHCEKNIDLIKTK